MAVCSELNPTVITKRGNTRDKIHFCASCKHVYCYLENGYMGNNMDSEPNLRWLFKELLFFALAVRYNFVSSGDQQLPSHGTYIYITKFSFTLSFLSQYLIKAEAILQSDSHFPSTHHLT